MTKPIKLDRLYNLDDALMIQFSRITKVNLEDNLADFTAFDADFDANYLTGFETAINNAEGFSSDNQLIDVQVQATLDLEAKMKECRDYYQAMKYFIEKTFPGKKGIWAEFGYNDYDRVRNRSVSFIQFYHDLFEIATKYAVELEAAGFDAAKIAKIETLTDELRDIKTTQDKSKGVRYTATNNRVLLLNAVWKITTHICSAGKVVYAQDYGKYQLFVLPSTNSNGSTNSTTYTGLVQSGETENIPIPGLTPETVLIINNLSSDPLSFCGGDHPNFECSNGFIVNPQDSQSITFQDLGGDAAAFTFLNVSHTISPPGSLEASFEITVVE